MRMRHIIALLALVCFCATIVAGCAQKARRSEQPRAIPAVEAVSVAPFMQPTGVSDLITGVIPENQGRIPADMLTALDRKLREVLSTESKRHYVWLNTYQVPRDMTRLHTSEQPQALPYWIEYGKKVGARLLLVPQVLDWHEREGSSAGVTQAAHVRVEFFLLNVPAGTVAGRSVFEEKQEGLVDNLLNVGSFLKRRGAWVTADVLAADGMRKAVKDLGL